MPGYMDRLIANALRRLHREEFGPRMDDSCWWYYDGKRDVYYYDHKWELPGSLVIQSTGYWSEADKKEAA